MAERQIGCSYISNKFLNHYSVDLVEMRESGFNTILLTLSENDLHFYYGTVKKMVRLAKKHGFIVYIDPWGVGGIFGGEAYSKLVMDNPSAKQINQKGKEVPAVCPNNPVTVKYLLGWIKKAAAMDIDYIFWDEPHFFIKDFKKEHSDFGCFCNECKRLFKKIFKYELDYNALAPEDFYTFKVNSIIDLLNILLAEVKKYNKKNALCLLPALTDEKGGYFDWDRITELKNLDIFGTDPYWLRLKKDKKFVFDFAKKVSKICKKNKWQSELWIQAYKLKKKDLNEIKYVIKKIFSKEFNLQSIMFWSYKCGYPLSYLQSESYELLWNEIVGLINELD